MDFSKLKIEHARTAAKVVVGHGVGMVLRQIIANNTNPKNAYEAAFIFIGKTSISVMATAVVDKRIDARFDVYEKWLKENDILPKDENEVIEAEVIPTQDEE